MEECKRFQSCIENFLTRQKRRLKQKHGTLPVGFEDHCANAISICHHATYLLETLYIKRESLSNAIQAFDALCQNCIRLVRKNMESSSLGDFIRKILLHIFVQYIRIRDGFVLLTSGECRHNADAEIARNEKRFRSRLSSLSKRNDGYTTLFSSKLGYSGYGWDEFHNEEVGVRRRLLDALGKCSRKQPNDAWREQLWETILDSGAEAFENAFDRHENEMKELQRELELSRSQTISKLEKILSHHGRGHVKLYMATEDKFERLELKNGGFLGMSELTIQRQGDAFKGHDSRGALPSHASKEDWIQMMDLPDDLKNNVQDQRKKSSKSSNKRKRLVIMDSDEEVEKETSGMSSNGTSFLKITVKEAEEKDAIPSASINEIKQQLGVDVNDLERGREDLEAEQEETKKAAYEDEAREIGPIAQTALPPYTEEIFDLIESIKTEEDKMKMYRNICARKLVGFEAWDAREALRFSLMTLGNLYLEYNCLLSDHGNFHYLKKAQHYFEEAIHVIDQLNRMNDDDDEDDIELKNRKRAILLCSGRAHTNLGKTFFDQSEMIRKAKIGATTFHRNCISKLSEAIEQFKMAEQQADILRTQAIVADASDGRAALHLIESKMLLSLTCRFQGDAYLMISKEKESVFSLKKASGIDENDLSILPKENKSDVLEAICWLLLERYDSCCSLIQTCSSLLDRAMRGDCDEKWNDEIRTLLTEGFDYTAKLSDALHKLADATICLKDVVVNHGVMVSTDILKLKVEVTERLKNRSYSDTCLVISSRKLQLIQGIPRNDLFRNHREFEIRPTQRLTIDDNKSKTFIDVPASMRRRNEKQSDDAFDNFGLDVGGRFNSTSEDVNIQESNSVKRYRKWGDELLLANGVDINAYPSCEPEKPDEMIRDLSD